METIFENGVSIKVWKMDVYELYLLFINQSHLLQPKGFALVRIM